MKPIPIILSPTRNRALNVFLGLVMSLVSVLLLLALATYHPTDASMNTASGADPAHAIQNWIGVFGATVSDILLQFFGITVFLTPLWIGGLGWTWLRPRSGGSTILRWLGTALAVTFTPALFGLLPWHWRWMHSVPVEGVMGRVIAGSLVVYLNTQGAWLVAAVLAIGLGLYSASDINFWTLKTTRLKIAGSTWSRGTIVTAIGATNARTASVSWKNASPSRTNPGRRNGCFPVPSRVLRRLWLRCLRRGRAAWLPSSE